MSRARGFLRMAKHALLIYILKYLFVMLHLFAQLHPSHNTLSRPLLAVTRYGCPAHVGTIGPDVGFTPLAHEVNCYGLCCAHLTVVGEEATLK